MWIDEAQVFPNIQERSVRIKAKVRNATGQNGKGRLACGNVSVPVEWDVDGAEIQLEVKLGDDVPLWSEFDPQVHHSTLALSGDGADHQCEVSFGLREFGTSGREFVCNGRKVHLRGTHHGGDFPLTGYPPTNVEYWYKLWMTCKEWGLNHVRFHSFCPPEAAFTAADEVGIYLQVECGMWNEISPGTEIERMMYTETDRMLRAYGNHPSFVLFSPSNEPKGHWKESLPKWIKHYRKVDPRHLYTTGTGWSLIDEPGPVADRVDYLAVHRIGLNLMRGPRGWFGRDYARSMRNVDVPNIVHENGQWCAYPDYSVIEKFTGYLQPGNYEIFRDSLKAHGLLDKNRDFALASGRFQLACYKEEVEANLRTPGLGGFQLLDLHDYMGQGTALVGLLDPFWESKGYVEPPQWKEFCSATVPLARLTKRVFTTKDSFQVPVEVAHYGAEEQLVVTPTWRIENARVETVLSGKWQQQTIPLGRGFSLGDVTADLASLPAPEEYTLVVELADNSSPNASDKDTNRWNFWLYPAELDTEVPAGVTVTRSWREAEKLLADGERVLLSPARGDLGWDSPPLDRLPVFWNRLMNPGWGRMLGLWCDATHPALAEFPTHDYCDWQWTEIVRGERAMNLDRLPEGLQPIVQAVDDWNRNWKLGMVFECRVGPGRLVVCTIDLQRDLSKRAVARQLRSSLLGYMASDRFDPSTQVTASELRSAFFDTLIMRKLRAVASAKGQGAEKAIDGDPNTYWLVGAPARGSRPEARPPSADA